MLSLSLLLLLLSFAVEVGGAEGEAGAQREGVEVEFAGREGDDHGGDDEEGEGGAVGEGLVGWG